MATYQRNQYIQSVLTPLQIKDISESVASGNVIFVTEKDDFPTPVNGVITLDDNITYFITKTIDLEGDRIVSGQNTVIIGGSSENCRLKSTGLTSNPLIYSEYSLPMRFITIEAASGVYLDASGNSNQALDWLGVNFSDCPSAGYIANYNNFLMSDCAFLNSGGLTFDGTIGTVGFTQCLFDASANTTALTITDTATITRRVRVIFSSFVVLSGETGIALSSGVSIPDEGYILDTVNFAGGGTYLSGLNYNSNKALFFDCRGIQNTSTVGQLFMQNNVTATTISNTSGYVKVAGTTTASSDNQKFDHSNNRLTYSGVIETGFIVTATLSITSGNNNTIIVGIYDSNEGAVKTSSLQSVTTSASGRVENVFVQCSVLLENSEYVEVWIRNTTSATNITVSDLNMIIREI